MPTNILAVGGTIQQGGTSVTSGYVRIKNASETGMIGYAQIGGTDHLGNTLPAGTYEVWQYGFNSSSTVTAKTGDVLSLTVYSTSQVPDPTVLLNDPVTVTPMFVMQTYTLTDADMTGVVTWNVNGQANQPPLAPVILAKDMTTNTNPDFTNNASVYWMWTIPSDPDGDPVSFKVEWAKDSAFTTNHGTATTAANDPARTQFSYEINPSVWDGNFQGGQGVPSQYYGNRCRFLIPLPSDGTWYWRVGATDNVLR